MELKEFSAQIERLKETYDPKSHSGRNESKYYPHLRVDIFWRVFKDVEESVFRETVDELIVTNRQPPMLQEITETLASVRARVEQARSMAGHGGYGQILEKAAANNKLADPELVQASMKLIRQKLTGQVTKTQFDEGCALLDQVADTVSPEGRARGVNSKKHRWEGYE